MLDLAQDRVGTSEVRWPALVAAVERLAESQSIDAVIAVIRDTARAISGADGVTFVVRDGEQCHYVDENAVGPLWKGKRFPLSACISGWCMLNRKTAAISDIYDDPRIPHDAYRPTFVKSLVMVPVGRNEPLAAIGSYWAARRNFDANDIALLEALARSAATAIAAVTMRGTVREREAQYSMALTAGKLGAFEWDLVNGELRASALTKAHFGREAHAAFSPNDLIETVHPEDRERVARAVAAALASGAEFDSDFRIVWPDGSPHWTELRGRVLRGANGAAVRVMGVTLDVTRRREAMARLDRLQADLAHLGRISDLGEMASALAHELKQPLTAAANYVKAARRLIENDAPKERQIEAVAKADGQFLRAHGIVERIRGFAAKTARSVAPEPVRPMIEEAVELSLIDPRRRNAELRLDMPDDLPPVLADKVQVQQVLMNLLRNAYESMADTENPRLAVSAAAGDDGATIAIRVADNGPGLAPEIAERLFQPFATTKANGMGVGLSICRGLIESHGGRMWHETGDPGAVFVFTLPVAGA